jgi:hypothetical protein
MSDSGSSSITGDGSTRMLERRVSNNRADLNGDEQMNHVLSWFKVWSGAVYRIKADGSGSLECL